MRDAVGQRRVRTSVTDITERAKQIRVIEHLNRLYSVLSRVSHAVVRATSPEEFLEQACREVVEGGGFLLAWIGQVDLMTNTVVPKALWGGIGEYVDGITVYADERQEGYGPTGTSIREQRAIVHNDFLHDPDTLPWRKRATPFGIKAAAAFPIEKAGRAWGALTIYSDEVDRFGDEDVRLLDKVAGDVGFALDNLDREFRRQQAEQALKESEEKFFLAFKHAPVMATITVLEDGTFLDVNDKFMEVGGFTREEVLGKTSIEIGWLRAEDRQRLIGALQRQGKFSSMEITSYAKNGRPVDCLYNCQLVTIGGVKRPLTMVQDITERKASEAALQESEAKFRSYIEHAPLAVFVSDREGRLLDFNPAGKKLLGYDSATLTGMNILDLQPQEEREKVLLGFTTLLEKGHVEGEYRLKRRDGSLTWVWFQAVMITDKLSLAYCQDIAERKKAEEERTRVETQLRQAQKMEALGTLAGGIAHDFNNILGIIIGFTEVAKFESGEGSPLLSNLDEVLNASKRAKELVKQILAFSRRSEQEKMPLRLGMIVKEAMRILRPSLPSTIEIKTEVLSKTTVLADPNLMHQVLMNLCTNAAHAMQNEFGILKVRLTDIVLGNESVSSRENLRPGRYVALSVEDSGHGIDPAIIDLIFDPFFTTKQLGEGTGLGLSVVHGIVESHGGTIKVESTPGKGTTFTVLIPAMEADYELKQLEIAVALPRGQERVLVVDDEPLLAEMVKRMLETQGYDVVSRTSGIEALEAFRHQPAEKHFDLVITDMTMPLITGGDLARELSALQPAVPIILMTGFGKKIDAARAKELGIRGFLIKPVTLEELARTVRTLLDERRAGPEKHPGGVERS
jgi:PAS domain S-box-containing protein